MVARRGWRWDNSGMKSLVVELVNTGSELLLGKVVNTNAAWLGERLFEIGLRVSRQTVVPDGREIFQAINEAASRSDVVIVSGGLGPTSDDVTREALSEWSGVPLVPNSDVEKRLRVYFEKLGREMSPSNLRQTMVPQGAEVLLNRNGTAPGLWMPGDEVKGSPIVILLPGPPSELRPMAEEWVFPRLLKLAGEGAPRMKEYKVIELGESALQDLVDAELEAIPGLEWGYCARSGEVDVRLVGSDEVLCRASEVLLRLAGDYLVTPLGVSIEEALVARLMARGERVSSAESCTGGLIAKRITDVPGASKVFHYGWVTYANEAKVKELGVSQEAIGLYTEVSEEVVRQMAEGALERSGADYAVAVSGFAGPDGGTPENPAGTVWLAWAAKGSPTVVRREYRPASRESFRMIVSQMALIGLYRMSREGKPSES